MNYRRLFIPDSIVFITFTTNRRREILIDNINLLRKSFAEAKNKFSFETIAACILKDHLHLLIKPVSISEYPDIVKTIKINFSKEFDVTSINDYHLSQSRKNKNEKDIWQRRYYEHTIKDESDLYKHIDYIHFNSVKHYSITPRDWKYSTFRMYVKQGYYDNNWCNFEDKYKISTLDYE